MTTSSLYHTQGIRGYQHQKTERRADTEIYYLHSTLKQMAKTIRKRIKRLLGYWKHGKLTNASQEGFNNKIGWLTRQAYGYRDENCLHLKIYDLPNLSTRRSL